MVTLLEDHTQAWGGDPNQHLIDAKFHILFFFYTKSKGNCPGDNRGDALMKNIDSAIINR